jgi:hypothetical protein
MIACLTFHAVLLTATVARKYWLFLNGDTRYTMSIVLLYRWHSHIDLPRRSLVGTNCNVYLCFYCEIDVLVRLSM